MSASVALPDIDLDERRVGLFQAMVNLTRA